MRRAPGGGPGTPDTSWGGSAEAEHERPDLSVVVPVTENPQPLDEIYEAFRAAFDAHDEVAEFLFVSAPWARGHLAKIRALARAGHPIRIFEVGARAGESDLLLGASGYCRGELIVTLPPYWRIQPAEIMKLVRRVREGAALASAARGQTGDHPLNRLQHWGFHTLLKRLVGTEFQDIASGVRVMRPEVLREVPLYGDAFRFLPLLAAREDFRVEEVVVQQHPRDRRTKVYSPGTYFRRVIDLFGMAFLTRFTHKPLRFFGLVGGALALAGATLLAVVVAQRLAGTPLANRPALVISVLLLVLGLQSVALGLIGEIIVHFSVGEARTYRLAEEVGGLSRGEPPGSESIPEPPPELAEHRTQ